MPPVLILAYAVQVQGIKMIGRLHQYFAVQKRCLRNFSALMM